MKHWIAKVTGEDWHILTRGKKKVLSLSLGNIIYFCGVRLNFRDGATLVMDSHVVFCEVSESHGAFKVWLSRL